MDKNNTNIFNGLIEESDVNVVHISLIGTNLNNKSKIAPIRAITQYVPIFCLLSFTLGKNIIETVIAMNVIKATIKVGIISITPNCNGVWLLI